MKPIQKYIQEEERLQELFSLHILDTPAEACFDEVTALASSVCEAPIAIVSLVDRQRQWFKSKVGLDATETPRDIAFCNYAILSDDIFVVNDARKDGRFADNPLVTGPAQIRFYAGVPLRLSSGYAVGSLCVIDNQARTLNTKQIESLKKLARQTVQHLETRRQNMRLSEQLVYTSKLAALGEMAASVAHEINTPLGIIAAKTELLTYKQDKGQLTTEFLLNELQKIYKTTDRIADIIKGLMRFSRAAKQDDLKLCSIQQIIHETLELCEVKFKKDNIQLSLESEQDFELYCQPVEISQILLNLFTNACYAISRQDEKWIRVRLFSQDQCVHLQVIDSGNGISQDVVNYMMNPFFTTKPAGVGTGLGLSISKGLAEAHGGNLTYQTWQGHTSFTLILPIQEVQQKVV